MDSWQFLDLVLPPASGGWFAVGTPTDKGIRFKKRQSAAQLHAEIDRAVSLDQDVFLVLAEFQEKTVIVDGKPGFKYQSNVRSLGAYFLDLDCGPTPNKFASKQDALLAFQDWLGKTKLPLPSAIVDSGGGIHIYWGIGTNLAPDTWSHRSKQLIAACKVHGFKADPVVTIDSSRFLRMPGSFNHKHNPPRPCKIIGGTGLHVAVDAFEQALDALSLTVPQSIALGPSGRLNDDLMGYQNVPSNADAVVERCEQMLWHWNTQGAEASEPEWFAALCLLAHLEGGPDMRHEISSGHPAYSETATDEKWQHALANSKGPTTCERFESLKPDLCASCQWRGTIKSPIQLGREAVPAAPPVVQQLLLGPPDSTAVAIGKYRIMPDKTIGVMTKADAKDAPEYLRVFFRGALTLKGIINREGGGYRYSFSLERANEPRSDVFLDGEVLYNSTSFGRWLGANHISVGLRDVSTMQDFTTHYIKQLQAGLPATLSYNGFGWRNSHKQFVIGNMMLSRDTDAIAPVTVNDRVAGIAGHISPAGTLEKWKAVAGLFTAPGMEAHAFGFAAGFGAPLMEFMPEKGTVLSLVSPRGSQGKTSVLRLQNSIYGDPDAPMLQPSDTVNARFHMAGILGNLPVTMDEITNMEPRDISDFLLNFTLGREKLRMKPDGSEIQTRHTVNHWATILTCTSNSSLAEKLIAHRGNPHAENLRLFEATLILPQELGTLDARDLLQDLKSNHGLAGLIYLRYVLDHLDEVKGMLVAESRRVVKDFEIPNYDRFATPLCTTIFVGAAIANRLKLTRFNLDAMRRWAVGVYTGRINEIATTERSAPQEILTDVLNDLQHDQTQLVRNGKLLTPNMKPAMMLINHDTGMIAISLRHIRAELRERHMDYGVVTEWLREKGWYKGEEYVDFYYGATGYTTPRKCLVMSVSVIGRSKPVLAVNNDIAPTGKIV